MDIGLGETMNKHLGLFALGFVALLSGSVARADIAVGDIATDVKLEHLMPDESIQEAMLLDRGDSEFVMLEFFTTWCSYCDQNRPIVRDLAKDLGAKVALKWVLMNRGHDHELALNYLRNHNDDITTPMALDPSWLAQDLYNVEYIPKLFLIDSKGKVLHIAFDVLTAEDIARIKELVNGKR